MDDLGEDFGLTAQVQASIEPQQVCQYMHTALASLVEALETAPGASVSGLEVLPEEERRKLLYDWNDTATEFPADRCIHELFEQQVAATPEATAVVYEDASLSYQELNQRANRVAHALRERGVKPDDRVALCLERGLEMVIGLLGVLKAGGAYVPLDPAYPAERLRYMLEDSAPVALLTQSHLEALLTGFSPALPVLDLTEEARWAQQPDSNPQRAGLTPEHLAYVIYTSGSTGMPKGVIS